MSWTQPVCRDCWEQEHPGRVPHRVIDADQEFCCLCGAVTSQGIYIRRNPADVPYPTLDTP